MKIVWFRNTKTFAQVNWDDLNYPVDEQSTFEPNGDGRSRYIYARLNNSNKKARVGKVILDDYGVGQLLFSVVAFLSVFAISLVVPADAIKVFLTWLTMHLFILVVCCIVTNGVIKDVRSKTMFTACTGSG